MAIYFTFSFIILRQICLRKRDSVFRAINECMIYCCHGYEIDPLDMHNRFDVVTFLQFRLNFIDHINSPRFDCCALNNEDKRPVLRRTNRKSSKCELNSECNTFARMVGYKKCRVGLEFRHY